jgi:hypothetical protein
MTPKEGVLALMETVERASALNFAVQRARLAGKVTA